MEVGFGGAGPSMMKLMSNEEEEEDELPPGFKNHPTDEEIIMHHLQKVIDPRFAARAIGEADLTKCEPWDLPKKAKMGEKEWFFFSQRDRNYPIRMRTNRATKSGYWKKTGKDKKMYKNSSSSSSSSCLVGMKKTLVYYRGRPPKGERTDWVMHEFRLDRNFSRSVKVGSCSDITSMQKTVEEEKILKTIKSLSEDEESGQFWLLATVLGVQDLRTDPYLVCMKCFKELDQEESRTQLCENCESFDVTGKHMYKVYLKVEDETGSMILNIWGKDSHVLYGKKLEDGQEDELPPQIDDDKSLSGIKALFEVIVFKDQTNKFYAPYQVTKIISNEEEIKNFSGRYLEEDESRARKAIGKTVIVVTPKNEVVDDDSENLLDDFSTTQKKKIKRMANKLLF